MRIFRDLGRYKARKRRQQGVDQQHALISMLMRKDDPLEDLLLKDASGEQEDESNLPMYTKDELYEFGTVWNDEDDDNDDEEASSNKLLISIFGRVYDVTKGHKYYGPDGPYSQFAGNDITYALATGCRTDECVDKLDYETALSDKEQNEGKRWLSFFHLHDKYPMVGKLEEGGGHFEALLNELLEEIESKSDEEIKDNTPPIMKMG